MKNFNDWHAITQQSQSNLIFLNTIFLFKLLDKRNHITLVPLVCVVLTLLGSVFSSTCGAVEVGEPVSVLKVKTIDGQTFDLTSEKGHVIIINFWATWCAPCRDEMPALDAYYKKHKAQGLKVLAISIDDVGDSEKVKEVMKAFSFPAAFARDANYRELGSIGRVPMTFVIDKQGLLRRDGSKGDPKIDLPLLEKTVTPLLQTK